MNKSILLLFVVMHLFAGDSKKVFTSSGNHGLFDALLHMQDEYPLTPPSSRQNSPRIPSPGSLTENRLGLSFLTQLTAQRVEFCSEQSNNNPSLTQADDLDELEQANPLCKALYWGAVIFSACYYFSR